MEAEIAELGGHRDDEAHMRHGNLVKRLLIPVSLPAQCEFVLFLACQIGRPHRLSNHASLRQLVHQSRSRSTTAPPKEDAGPPHA
jgi:hypothetical protein